MRHWIFHIPKINQIYISNNPQKFVAELGYSESDYLILKMCKSEIDALELSNFYRKQYNYPEEQIINNASYRWRLKNKNKLKEYNHNWYKQSLKKTINNNTSD